MKKFSFIAFIFVSAYLLQSCSKPKGQYIIWDINPSQPIQFTLNEKPIHYKYALKVADTITYNPKESTITMNSSTIPKVVTFTLNDFEFPLFLDGKTPLKFHFDRSNSENPISIEGYPKGLLESYYSLLQSEKPIQEAIRREKPKFAKGESNTYVKLLEEIQLNRKAVLMNSPYEFLYWSSYGELLSAQLESLTKENVPLLKRYSIRKSIISSAQQNGFFKLKSLESQRAGIRDFTNAWAHSFGIADSVRKAEKNEALQIYDINRMAYPILNKHREEVLLYVEDDKAKAYAQMYLTAERLGEAPYEDAQKAMLRFIQTYADRYPEYTDFIAQFNEAIRRVQPGMPAFDFEFPDKNGNLVSLNDLKEKIIYIDFWASWCSPCLQEFPFMKKVYSQIDTSKTIFIGIGLDQNRETWKSSLDRYQLPWINLYGGNEFNNELFKLYRGAAIPLTVLIGKDGKIERYNDIRASYNLKTVLSDLELTY